MRTTGEIAHDGIYIVCEFENRALLVNGEDGSVGSNAGLHFTGGSAITLDGGTSELLILCDVSTANATKTIDGDSNSLQMTIGRDAALIGSNYAVKLEVATGVVISSSDYVGAYSAPVAVGASDSYAYIRVVNSETIQSTTAIEDFSDIFWLVNFGEILGTLYSVYTFSEARIINSGTITGVLYTYDESLIRNTGVID